MYPMCNIGYTRQLGEIMKISLTLCMLLTFASSVLITNQSDPFNQKSSASQEKIKTGLGSNQPQYASKDFVDKYMIPGLNITSTGASVLLGASLYQKGYLEGFLPFLVISSALNTASMVDATKSSPANTIVGVTNLVWAAVLYFAAKPIANTLTVVGGPSVLPAYFTFQATMSAFNAVYKLGSKKQQN